MKNNMLIAGLPGTGKSSFIAALWGYITSSSEYKPLKLGSLSKGDYEYLNTITRAWHQYEPLARNVGAKMDIQMDLIISSSESRISVDIPDFSGEIFRDHFDYRVWDKEYDILLETVDGILLFVSPYSANNHPVLIDEINSLSEILAPDAESKQEVVSENPRRIVGYKPEFTCNQVKLVEELQFILYHKPEILPIRVGIVVSAWDTIEKAGSENMITPAEWVERELPLLYQFLFCNNSSFECEYFGISAQGVAYEDEKATEAMYGLPIEKRVTVRFGNNSTHEITKPILWVIE
jgi:Double-GTPase 1